MLDNAKIKPATESSVPLGICRSSFPRTLTPERNPTTLNALAVVVTAQPGCIHTQWQYTHRVSPRTAGVISRGHQPGSTASPNKLITQSGNCDGKVTQPKGEIGQRPRRLHSFPKQVFSFSKPRSLDGDHRERLPDLLAWDMSRHVCNQDAYNTRRLQRRR
jgi:hypothetical protein